MRKNEFSYITPVHVYTLIDRKHMVLNNVMEVFVLIIIDSLKKQPYPYRKHVTITLLLALFMSKVDHIAEDALILVQDIVHLFNDVELILLLIILNEHFHLIMLDKGKTEYIHYLCMIVLLFLSSFCLTNTCSIDKGNHSIDVWQSNLER